LTTLTILAPANFWGAGDLSQRFASKDPRLDTFVEASVDVDMRTCRFVRPPAVLWCVIYSLLAVARGSPCRLLVPENMGVCTYLKSLGLFPALQQAGVEVDDRGVRTQPDPQLVLPLTGFREEAEVEKLANEALDALTRAGLGSANLHPLVSEVFAELALNAVQHSESEIGAFGFIQFYEFQQGRRFVCAVADGGIGIRRSLERNPDLCDRVPYDWVAIELALRERVSGTGLKTRGIGLYGVAEDMRKAGRRLIIHSGFGIVETSEEMECRAERAKLFPGTVAYASIPT
jgi:anti-sigma regulatory factor (Ser/Thr protein kinase)